MIYTITAVGIFLVFVIEFLIQKHETNNFFSFFKSVSLFKTIEQMLIVVLSATIAILITDTAQEQKMKNRYYDLLKNLYAEAGTESNMIKGYLDNDPDYDFLQNTSDEYINAMIRSCDYTDLMDTIIYNSDAIETLSPSLYLLLIDQINERELLLEALFTNDYTVYGDRLIALDMLQKCDEKIAYLILAQAQYFRGIDDVELADEYTNGIMLE